MIHPKFEPLRRATSLSFDEFLLHKKLRTEPLLLENFDQVKSWPILKEWSIARLHREFGELKVKPRVNFPDPDDDSVSLFRLPVELYPPEQEMALHEFLERILKSETAKAPCYLQAGPESKRFIDSLPGFRDGIGFDKWFGEDSPYNCWIGSAGTRAEFHQDDRDNLVLIVEGAKRVLLGAPEYTDCFYPIPGTPDKSGVRPEGSSSDHPRLADATILEGEIQPGEVLFLPRGWWHTFRACKPTIMLNCWFGERLTKSDFKQMYTSLGASYRMRVHAANLRNFMRTTCNLLAGRAAIAGMPVWYMPGCYAAIRTYNAVLARCLAIQSSLGGNAKSLMGRERVSFPRLYE